MGGGFLRVYSETMDNTEPPEGHIWGVEVWFDPAGPVARYLIDIEDQAPRLTTSLIDELLDAVDVYEIERVALQAPVGQPMDVAGRTLEGLREALHALVHGTGSSDAGLDPSSGEPA